MKTFLTTTLLLALLATDLHASADLVQKRAKELRDQNNVRQGVPPPAPPAQRPGGTPQQSAAPAISTTQQQYITKVKTDLAQVKPGSQITPTQKQQLTKDLLATAQGTAKPSQGSVSKLVDSLVNALADKSVSAIDQARLTGDLVGILNSAKLTPTQTQNIGADVQAILQAGGVKRQTAVNVANDLKPIVAEVQKK